jgi:hypothetical protein
MRQKFIIIFWACTCIVNGQNIIDWDGKYQLQLSDFQSATTQIGLGNIYSLHTGSGMDFSFYMSNAEFIFTKNFNSKVNCSFKRDAASIVSPDSLTAYCLLEFARYEFDLSELYARKFRKKMYEEKKAFSNVSFYRPLYDEIQREFNERHTTAGVQSDLGRNKEKLKELHQAVLLEIEQLPDFCKLCKPQKQKK